MGLSDLPVSFARTKRKEKNEKEEEKKQGRKGEKQEKGEAYLTKGRGISAGTIMIH
jgi:hypothetical protein